MRQTTKQCFVFYIYFVLQNNSFTIMYHFLNLGFKFLRGFFLHDLYCKFIIDFIVISFLKKIEGILYNLTV